MCKYNDSLSPMYIYHNGPNATKTKQKYSNLLEKQKTKSTTNKILKNKNIFPVDNNRLIRINKNIDLILLKSMQSFRACTYTKI